MVYNIAHVGLLSPIKGIKIFNQLSREVDANWFIIGGLEEYEKLDWSHVTITGHYRTHEELADLIDYYEIDFALSLSMCPESFSYTLSECWDLGLPVIGTNLGAIGNRISKIHGITVDPYNYEETKQIIQNINPEQIPIGTPVKLNDMLRQYEEIYVQVNRC